MRSLMKQAGGRAVAMFLLCSGIAAATPGWAPQRMVTVSAGTSLLVRMVDSVDSSKNPVRSRFTASLETNLVVAGVVLAPSKTTVHGRLSQSKEAGRVGGKSQLQLQLELTDIVVDGFSAASTRSAERRAAAEQPSGSWEARVWVLGLAPSQETQGKVRQSARSWERQQRTAVAQKGETVSTPSETLLEFRLQQPASLPSPT